MFLECIGSVGFWSTILTNETRQFQINHTFQKQSPLSQFEILGANGRLKLSVPTIKATRKNYLDKVEIDYSMEWQNEHWRSIRSAYRNSPFFIFYDYKIEPVFKKRFERLIDFNLAMANCISDCIKLQGNFKLDSETPSMYQGESYQSNTVEYPQVFDTKHEFQKNLSVLDLLFNLGPESKDFLIQK